MTINRDLFLAILAMDSYNRGYGVGVELPQGNTGIGNATILDDSSVLVENGVRLDIPAGFYAIAYDVSGVAGFGATEKVISYGSSVAPPLATAPGLPIAPLQS